LKGKKGTLEYVAVDPAGRALIIAGYLVLLLVFLFGYDYSNIPIALGAVGFILILSIGIILLVAERVYVSTGGSRDKKVGTSATWGLIWGAVALFALGAVAFVTQAAFGLPVAVAPALSQLSLNTATVISFVFNSGAGVAEEMLNLAVLNIVIKLTNGNFYFAIGTSGFIRAVYHIPIYGSTGPNFFVVFGAGIVLSTIIWITRSVSVAMGAHIASNVLVALKALVTGS
jgi:membrane protease YdiL (CAAX protease family)